MRSLEDRVRAAGSNAAATTRVRTVEPTPPSLQLLQRAQRSAGNRAVTQWLTGHRPLQREMTTAVKGRKVKVWVASRGELITATVVEDFDVDHENYNGFVTVQLEKVYDGRGYGPPKRKSEAGAIIGIDPSYLYDESVADATILGEHREEETVEQAPDAFELLVTSFDPSASESSDSEEETEAPEKSTTGGQAEKAEREIANKLAGQKQLAAALDLVATKAYKDGEHVVNGFTIVKKGKELMIALFRKMTAGEAKAMESAKGISRKQYTDPYKWFSESGQHSEGSSVGGGGGMLYKVFLDADDYLAMRKGVKPEYAATEAAENRFHQENLGAKSPLINFGVHAEEEETFNKAIKKIEQVRRK